ncbi:enoyl-CoA hydratase/isomerase family protein [Actinoplanes aureus]|uniref:Enoyl-CoA hydratase/isomerase family protein n=1 Tax=Actinoplanes aureus TaxID=2792083 RepID=A0A931FVN8_9ACTN|nr:enoyl-CoA hydratase/isomerase family protein [Actinoplanes aureus]MBG0561523.1 enoyl-CoA hydratase/isomerase family protein [Actinoplanes aureus]
MIERDEIDGVAVVRLAHGKVNALDVELLHEIADVFTSLAGTLHPAVVLTGAGRSFSAGVDLWRVIDGGAGYVDAFLPALSDALLAVFTLGKPVVAAINGHAIAGGAILACAADHRLMADTGGRIGVSEVLVGVPFPPVPLEIARFALGETRARAAVISGRAFEPAEAVEAGFADEIVPASTLLPAAVAAARRLATDIPADTFKLTKHQLRLPVHDRLARDRPVYDVRVRDLWVRGVEDGRLRRFMQSLK